MCVCVCVGELIESVSKRAPSRIGRYFTSALASHRSLKSLELYKRQHQALHSLFFSLLSLCCCCCCFIFSSPKNPKNPSVTRRIYCSSYIYCSVLDIRQSPQKRKRGNPLHDLKYLNISTGNFHLGISIFPCLVFRFSFSVLGFQRGPDKVLDKVEGQTTMLQNLNHSSF